jgi:heme/copper-type cytochrome/quinol oxidase subunit 3
MSQAAAMQRTSTGIPNGKLGMWVFLASEVMLFGALISSYVVLSMGSPNFGRPAVELLGKPLATLNTFVLITSSVTMVMALSCIQRNNVKGLLAWLGLTSLLGLGFLGIKAFEYHHKISEGITITSSLFGSFYYTLTGLHGLHMLGGLAFNAYIAVKAMRGGFSADHYERVEYAALYWHFVDLVWVILFPLFYLV